MPLTTKLYPTFEGFSKRVMDGGKNLIGQADDIYLIGYRAADEIIRDMFKNVRPETQLHVVGTGSAGQIMDEVLEWSKIKRGEVHSEGFAKFIEAY